MKFSEALDLVCEEYSAINFNGLRFYIKFLEGTISHIHFENKDKTISGAIRLDKPLYFPHGNPLKYASKLSKKELQKFIQEISKNNYQLWKQLVLDWNKNCRNGNKIDISNIPNYLELC